MLLHTPLELDLPNQGSRFVPPIIVAFTFAERRAPALVTFVRMAAGEWRKLVQQISGALTGERRNRRALERDLFRGKHTVVSKGDDDLRVP
jgi:hypothetical protein